MKVEFGATGIQNGAVQQDTAPAKLAQAARDFEAVLLRRMLSALEKSMQMQSGKSGSMYGTMVVDAMADAISKSGGLGMAKVVEESLPGAKASNDR
jgi:Rod binding domain-containing protein